MKMKVLFLGIMKRETTGFDLGLKCCSWKKSVEEGGEV